MKIKNKIIALLGLTVFLSCGKEEITVINNLDTNVNPSQDLVDKDIRTRIGYDPRFYYAGFSGSEVAMPVLTIGDLEINREVVGHMAVAFDKPLDKETTIAVEYDAAAFEKVKENYEGYVLGNQSLITLTKSEVVIPKGETVASFELKMQNKGTEKVLVPFSFKIKNNDTAKVDELKSYFVAKVYPEAVSYKVAQTSMGATVTINRTGILKTEDNDFRMSVTASNPIPADIKLGLVRDDSLFSSSFYSLAPAGVEGNITPIDFNNQTTGEFQFSLVSGSYSAFSNSATVQIPFKLVVYGSDGTAYDVPHNDITAIYTVRYHSGVEVFDSSASEYLDIDYLNRISNSDFRLTSTGREVTNLAKMFDEDENSYGVLKVTSNTAPALILSSMTGGTKMVKAIRIKTATTHSLKKIRVRTSVDGFRYTDQGTYDFTAGKDGYAIIFGEPVDILRIRLDYFGIGNEIHIQEVELFEE